MLSTLTQFIGCLLVRPQTMASSILVLLCLLSLWLAVDQPSAHAVHLCDVLLAYRIGRVIVESILTANRVRMLAPAPSPKHTTSLTLSYQNNHRRHHQFTLFLKMLLGRIAVLRRCGLGPIVRPTDRVCLSACHSRVPCKNG